MFTIETKVLEKGTFRYKLRNVLDAICHPAKTKKMKSIYDKANALIDENIYSATFVLKFGTVWLDYDDLYEINTRPIEKDFIKNHTYVYFVDSDGNEHPLVDESYHYIYLCKYKSEDTPYDIGFITYLEEYGWYVMDYRMLLINKQTYEKSIFMDFIQKPLTKDKVHLDIILDDSKLIEARSLMKKYTFVCNVGRYVYKFLHTLDSVYLCLRFPFLYPRNRFTDRYYNNWKIQEKVDKWKKESTLSLRICMFKDESKYFCTQTNELPEVKQKQSDSNPENVMYYIDNGTKDGYYLYDKSQNQKLNSIVKVKNDNDSGYDMYIYHTGIAVESEKHYGIFLFPRSSNRKTNAYLCNHVGIVDSAIYRGEIMFCYKNRTSLETLANNEGINYLFNSSWKPITVSSGDSITFAWKETLEEANNARNWFLDNPMNFAPYKVGDRIGQMVVLPYPNVKITEVAELSETERGSNGFGSTGN